MAMTSSKKIMSKWSRFCRESHFAFRFKGSENSALNLNFELFHTPDEGKSSSSCLSLHLPTRETALKFENHVSRERQPFDGKLSSAHVLYTQLCINLETAKFPNCVTPTACTGKNLSLHVKLCCMNNSHKSVRKTRRKSFSRHLVSCLLSFCDKIRREKGSRAESTFSSLERQIDISYSS